MVAGLFQFHQAQVGKPEATPGSRLTVGSLRIRPPTFPLPSLTAAQPKAAVERVPRFLQGPLPLSLGLPLLIGEGQFLALDGPFECELPGVTVSASDLVLHLLQL